MRVPDDVIVKRLEVDADSHGFRLDRFIQRSIPRLSRSRIHRILHEVRIDGVPADKPSRRVYAGSVVEIHRPAPREPEVPRHFEVLHDDAWMLAIDKPSGLPMHTTARFYRNTLTALLRERYPGEPLQLAHRIDKETSGALLVARGPHAKARIQRAFLAGAVDKRYLAIVRGTPPEGEISVPLRLDPRSRTRVRMQVVASGTPGALTACTALRVVERVGELSLIECRLIASGRQHQIRVHLAHLGCALVGDKLYGPPGEDALFMQLCDLEREGREAEARVIAAERLGLGRHALHASLLGLPHPGSGAWIEIHAPLPADLRGLLGR